jgi:hypothetical protein
LDRDKHNQDKQDLIKAVNTEIDNYNKEWGESLIKQINFEDIDKINQADIENKIADKINQINGKKGGKSTRKRRKMNPTRKGGRIKPKTKKKSKRGALKKRKTHRKK